ncbi:MAG TPA: rhomboid family intramembrane serine protease [Candidatus Udaeobacter sp.]|nr:rhomboid family intramembrane serine protease [Candidatus Udaeobacter sp.]
MNLNHILLFLAIVSPLLVLARGWRSGRGHRSWQIASLVVLATTGVTWLFWPDAAGYVGGGTWLFLLFLPSIGLQKMTELSRQNDYKSAANLGATLRILHPARELREQVQLFRRLASDRAHVANFRSVPTEYEMARRAQRNQLRIPPAVLVLIVVNILAFLFEVATGGWNDFDVLHRMGALEPYAVSVQREYWRLFTALFLHGGFMHLGFNIFALYILGPPLERAIGTVRFSVCYLISGLISSAGVVALSQIGLVQVAQLIGASGSIMGIVGAWGGFLMRQHRTALAKQRLTNIGLIVAIQIAFDLSTPEVSLAAHLCGLVAGFFLGLMLAPRALPPGDECPAQIQRAK